MHGEEVKLVEISHELKVWQIAKARTSRASTIPRTTNQSPRFRGSSSHTCKYRCFEVTYTMLHCRCQRRRGVKSRTPG